METSPDPKETKKGLPVLLGVVSTIKRVFPQKAIIQGVILSLIVWVCWSYADIFKPAEKCYKAGPRFDLTVFIDNEYQGWEEFIGLKFGGILKTVTNGGEDKNERDFDLISGKLRDSDKTKIILQKERLKTYKLNAEGCISSFTLVARIQTLSGSEGSLNGNPGKITLSNSFPVNKEGDEKLKSRKCEVEFILNPIDPMAQGTQVPSGKISMNCR